MVLNVKLKFYIPIIFSSFFCQTKGQNLSSIISCKFNSGLNNVSSGQFPGCTSNFSLPYRIQRNNLLHSPIVKNQIFSRELLNIGEVQFIPFFLPVTELAYQKTQYKNENKDPNLELIGSKHQNFQLTRNQIRLILLHFPFKTQRKKK